MHKEKSYFLLIILVLFSFANSTCPYGYRENGNFAYGTYCV